jgi:hypothetical protein
VNYIKDNDKAKAKNKKEAQMSNYKNLETLKGWGLVSECERLASKWGKANLTPSEILNYLIGIEENGYKASVTDKARLTRGVNKRYLMNALAKVNSLIRK